MNIALCFQLSGVPDWLLFKWKCSLQLGKKHSHVLPLSENTCLNNPILLLFSLDPHSDVQRVQCKQIYVDKLLITQPFAVFSYRQIVSVLAEFTPAFSLASRELQITTTFRVRSRGRSCCKLGDN